ncbi:MAG: SGNH/GDSL hydrolase family protein [Lachnospiraceae bacterium]|nr:SGNH/GDSL hydrolase family protein [Lachnospiraceae bacterium]
MLNRRNIICLILSLLCIAYVFLISRSPSELTRLFHRFKSSPAAENSEAIDASNVLTDESVGAGAEALEGQAADAIPPAADASSDGRSESASDGVGDSQRNIIPEATESDASRTAAESDDGSKSEASADTDASFFQKLAQHQDVRILVIGDSIGLGVGASDVSNRWDALLEAYLGRKYESAVTVQNECFGGCPSYGVYVRLKQLAEREEDYDLTIVCCGQNDSDDGFAEIYEALLRNINIEFPRSSVICILESTQKEMTDKMDTVQSLAKYYRAGVADTVEAFAKNYESLTQGGFYPNDEGQEMYFRTIINLIDPLVDEGCGVKIGGKDVLDLPLPVNPEVVNYDHLTFYPVSELASMDEVHYELDLSNANSAGVAIGPVSGRLGVEMLAPTGEFIVRTLVDGQMLGETNIINYTENDEARYYNYGGFTAENQIQVEFESQEAAERLTGIYVSTAEADG